MTDRPFRDEPTEVLQVALTLAGAHAQYYARSGPKRQENDVHAVTNLFLDELQQRGGLTALPPSEGPEYTPCTCGHIEPEHKPDATACLLCDCDAYRAEVRIADCLVCGTPIAWVDCPTGGWWAHDVHPSDDHDATPAP
ncbi:hypothetical protein [Streptomyces sp. NPDC004230]